MARTRINPGQISAGTIIGAQGTDHNPLPTTAADSPSSSVTFSLGQASSLYITFGCNMQINTALNAYLYLNVDGSDVVQCHTRTNTAGQEYHEVSRMRKVDLAAGSHTIKLRGMASAPTAAVNISPYWWGIILPQ